MESAFEGATARPAFPSRRAGRLRRIAARLPIYAANVRDNPQWLAMFILGRLLPVRQALWRLSPDRDVHDCSRSMFPGSDAVVAVSELCREGLYCGLQLPESVWQDILGFGGFGQETFCFGNMSRDVEFRPENHQEALSLFNRPILTGHFFDRVEKCPAIVSVRDDPLLRAIAANYLGRKARVISTRLWWSFPASKASDSDLSLAPRRKSCTSISMTGGRSSCSSI